MEIVYLLYRGALLGLSVAIPIGPINIEIARRTLRYRRSAGLAVGFGAVTGDVCWAVITGLALLPFLGEGLVKDVLGVSGALLLLWLAWLCIASAQKPHSMGEASVKDHSASAAPHWSSHFRTGLLMAALSPYNLAFWLVGVPGLVANLTQSPRRDLPWVVVGVFLGATTWVLAFSTVVHHIGRLGKEKWLKLADLAGALLLLMFALVLIWQVLRSHL